jgi:hypothetical protein
MKNAKVLFSVILVFMFSMTVWASLDQGVFDGFRELLGSRWGITTIADTYCAFLSLLAWVMYKESSSLGRVFWFVLIISFGNIAMSSYVLLQIWKLPKNSRIEDLLLRRPVTV